MKGFTAHLLHSADYHGLESVFLSVIPELTLLRGLYITFFCYLYGRTQKFSLLGQILLGVSIAGGYVLKVVFQH